MSSGGALHFESSTDLQYGKFQNVPLRKSSSSDCRLEIGYNSSKESLQLLLLSPSTNNSFKIHLTTLNLSESDSQIKSKKSNKMVIDNKTNDSFLNESTNVLTTKPKNKHKDKTHKEIRYCDAVNQSGFGKMDKAEGKLNTSFLLKEESEKYSHKKTRKHKTHHSENMDTDREFKKDKKVQVVTNEEEDLMAYKRKKKLGVDKATDPLGYTANLIKNSQLCFVLSTGSNPFKGDNSDPLIKVKGALINGKEKRSKSKKDNTDGVDLKGQESNESIRKRPKSDGISFFFKKKKLFSRNASVKDDEIKSRVDSANKLEEAYDKSTRRKSKKREDQKSVNIGKEKHKHSKNRSLSADATAKIYVDRESLDSKSYVGDAFKILKRSKKRNASLNSDDTKREKAKTKNEKVKKRSHGTDDKDAKHNKKSDNEDNAAWYKLKRRTKTRSNSLSGFEGRKEQDKNREAKFKEKDGKSIIESIKKHHKSKKKRDKSKSSSLCVVTSDTQMYSNFNEREKLLENLKTKKKGDEKVGTPNISHHRMKRGSKDKKESEKLRKRQNDSASENKERTHHEYKQIRELEEVISRGAKEIHDELKQDRHRDHHRERHHERRQKSPNKSKHKSKSRDRSKNVKDNIFESEKEILKKVTSDSSILNKTPAREYVISNSDYAVILEKIVSGKHSFNELTTAIEENHFFEALKSGSLLTPKPSSNLKELAEDNKSYSVSKKQLEVLINYLKTSVDVKTNTPLEKSASENKLIENKLLEREEISFSKLNLNPMNAFYDRNCWDRFVPKNKRQKRRMPFDQHSIVSDAITAKEKSQYLAGNKHFQNRTPRNFAYSESITERSNRSHKEDQPSGLGFTVEGVEPPKKLRPDVSSINLAKLNKDENAIESPGPDNSSENLTKSNMKKPLQISVLSVLEIKPNFAEVFNKSNLKFAYDVTAQPLDDMVDIKEEPERESKSILKKTSNTSECITNKVVSNVSISRKQSTTSGKKLNVISSAISQNKSRLSISESTKSVDLKYVLSNQFQNSAPNQSSKTNFQVKGTSSFEARKKLQPSSFPEDNRKALKKYSLLSEKCSLSEPPGNEGLNRDLDKDQLANLGQEVLEMMKKYINLSKSEECPNMDLSSFGAEFLTNVRTCIHERLKPVKEELDTETKEEVLPRTDSKSLTKRPSSTTKRIREDINKCVQNYLDSNSVASINQEDLSKITNNVTKKVESFLNDSKKEKSPSTSKITSKKSVSSKEGVRARMANYINTINEKRRGSSVTGSRSRDSSLDRNGIKRTLSNLSRGSSRCSVNFKRSVNNKISDKSLNDFSIALGSTSSGLSAISVNDSTSLPKSVAKKVEDGNETAPSVDSDAGMPDDKKLDLVNENIEVPDMKCSISSVLLPKIAEESPSQNSMALNSSQKAPKQNKPAVVTKPCTATTANSKEDPKVTEVTDSSKIISENKPRKHVSKFELNEQLKLIAQDMSERVMNALKYSSDEGSVAMTGDDVSSAASQISDILTKNASSINNKMKPPVAKVSKIKTQSASEKNISSASLHQKDSQSILKKPQAGNLNKPIIKKKKKISDKVSNFSHNGSESQFALKATDLTPLQSIDKSKENNFQSTENVAILNELISKNIMNILGKNSQLTTVKTTKEKVKKKKEVRAPVPVVKLVENEESDRKKKIIDKLAAAILDDKIFGNLESQLSKLLDKESVPVDSNSTKKVVANNEQVRKQTAAVVKKEIKKNVSDKVIKPREKSISRKEVPESVDPKKVLPEKGSKIPRYTRFGTKSTTSHFGILSDAGNNIVSISKPTVLPKPLKKTTNAIRTANTPTNNTRLPVPSKSSTPKEETGARPLSTFEKRKLYAANMRAKQLSSKSEAGFAADECVYGKPYEILYVTGEGPSVDPNGPLSKYIFDDPSNSKKMKKNDKGCEKKTSCTEVKAALSTELIIEYTPSNNKLNISSNQHAIEQNSAIEIRSENNFLRDCDNDSNIFRNKCARRASSVSLYSQESRFSEEICMHCLTPKATISLVSIPTNNNEKMYSTRSNSILQIDGSDSYGEMVKKPRFVKKRGRQVSNVTNFLGYNKEVLSAYLKTTEGSSNATIKTSPKKLLKSQTNDSAKRVKSCGGFIGVWKKIEAIKTKKSFPKKRSTLKSFSSFEEPHSSNYHPEIKIKKKIKKLRKSIFVEVADSSICDNLLEKPKKPKKKRNKKCLSEFSLQSSKCEYFNLHKPLINLTRVIKKQNEVLCAKVNKLKNFQKSKNSSCSCECEGSEVADGCYTIFKNFHCSQIPQRYFSDESFQFFRFNSLTDLDTNYSTTSVQSSVTSKISNQKYFRRVDSNNNSVNVESGYETHSNKTARRFLSVEENILSQYTSGFRYFDATLSFPAVYNVFPVSINGNQPKCCEELNRKPQSPCAKFRLKQARSCDKGTSPKPNKVTFKKCVVESDNYFCENHGSENCDCKNCAGNSSKSEHIERPRVLVCRNPKCPKNIQAARKHSEGRASEDEFSIIRCKNSDTSQCTNSSMSSTSRLSSADRQFSSSSTYSCGYSELPEVNIKRSGSIKSGCIPKYIWCKVKNRENSPAKNCSCGTNYQTFQKEKEKCKEYAQKVRKESSIRKDGRFKQFSDFKEIPLCVLLNTSNECNKDSCPKYGERKTEGPPKLKVLDKDYDSTSELSCMLSKCPRNPKAVPESLNNLLTVETPRDSINSDQMDIPKNLNNLSKESLIDIIKEQFQSSMKNIFDNSKDRLSVSSKEVSAHLIEPGSSSIVKDTSVQAISPLIDKTSQDLVLPSNENREPTADSIIKLVREELEYSIKRMPSTSGPSPAGGEQVRNMAQLKQPANCMKSNCQKRKAVPTEPPPPATGDSKGVSVPNASSKKTLCSLKTTPSGKKDVNCHCLDFQNMPKGALLKLKEQIDKCLVEENAQNDINPKQSIPRMSKKSSFPFSKNPAENQFLTNFMQTPLESSNLSRNPFSGLSSPSAPLYGNSVDVNKVPVEMPFSDDASHTLFLESYWGSTENNMSLPEEIAKPLLLPRGIASENLKGTRESFSSTEDIPSKEQSFKTPSKQQILNNSYPEDARCDSNIKINNNFSIPNMLNKTLKELEFINATKQSLEVSSEKLSKQLKTLSIELLLQSTNQEDSNNSQYENVTSMKEAIDTTFRHLLYSSKEALNVSSKEAQNQLMQSITELSTKSISDNSLREYPSDAPKRPHKPSRVKSKESAEASLLVPKTSSPSGTFRKSKGSLEGRRRTFKEPRSESSTEVFTEANDRNPKVSSNKSIISTSSKGSQETNTSQEITTVEEDELEIGDSLTHVEENCQTSNMTVKVSKQTSTDPIDPATLPCLTKGVDTRSSVVEEIVNVHTVQMMHFESIAYQNSSTSASQLSTEILSSNSFKKKEGANSKETAQENVQDFKDSLLSLMDLIEIKSDELLNSAQESLVVSLDEITMMNESNLSSEDLSNKLGVLFKTSLVKLLDMKPESFNESLLQETFRNTVEALLNDVFDEASNEILRCNLAKPQLHLNSELYRGMFYDFMNESDSNPFEKPIDTISKVAIVMLVQKISSVKTNLRSNPVPDELLIDMAKVSLQAIIELYKKMYSKKEVNVSFKVMVEDMCKNHSLNKDLKPGLTGSQLEIIDILDKKYVSESNTKNYKNCLCSHIKDKSTTPAEQKKEEVNVTENSKFTVISSKPNQESNAHKLEIKEKPLTIPGEPKNTKITLKSKTQNQQSNVHPLEIEEKPSTTPDGLKPKVSSSKFIVKSKKVDQKTKVHELEIQDKPSTSPEQTKAKFSLKSKKPNQQSNIQPLAVQGKPSTTPGGSKGGEDKVTGSSQFTMRNRKPDQPSNVHDKPSTPPGQNKPKFSLKSKIPNQQSNIYAKEIEDKPSPLPDELKGGEGEYNVTDGSKFTLKSKKPDQQSNDHELEIKDKPSTPLEQSKAKFSLRSKKPDQRSNVHAVELQDKPSKTVTERNKEEVTITGSSKVAVKDKKPVQQSDINALEIKGKLSTTESQRKKEEVTITSSSKFAVKDKKSDQQSDVHGLEINGKPSTTAAERKKEEVKITGGSKATVKDKKSDQQSNVHPLEIIDKPSTTTTERKVGEVKVIGTSKFTETDEKPDQKSNVHALEMKDKPSTTTAKGKEEKEVKGISKVPVIVEKQELQSNIRVPQIKDKPVERKPEVEITGSSNVPVKDKKQDQQSRVQSLEIEDKPSKTATERKEDEKIMDSSKPIAKDKKTDQQNIRELEIKDKPSTTAAELKQEEIKVTGSSKITKPNQPSNIQALEINDKPSTPTADQQKQEVKITGSSKVHELKVEDRPLTRTERKQEEVPMTGSSKYTEKDQNSDLQSELHALEGKDKLSKPQIERKKEEVKVVDNSKFTVKVNNQDQQNNIQAPEIKDKPTALAERKTEKVIELTSSSNVHELDIENKPLTSAERKKEIVGITDSSNDDALKTVDKPSTTSAQRKLQQVELTDNSKLTVKGKKSDLQSNIDAPEIQDKPSKKPAERKNEQVGVTDGSNIHPLEIEDKSTTTQSERQNDEVELTGSSKVAAKSKNSDLQSNVDAPEIEDKPSRTPTERKKEDIELTDSSNVRALETKDKPSTMSAERKEEGKITDQQNNFRAQEVQDKSSTSDEEEEKQASSIMGNLKSTVKGKTPDRKSNIQALEKLREELSDRELFEKVLTSYEKEEKIIDRLSKDDVFFQSQLELVKSKESIKSMFENASSPSSSSHMLNKLLSESVSEKVSSIVIEGTSPTSRPNSSTTFEDVPIYWAKEDEKLEKSKKPPPQQKNKLRSSLEKLSKSKLFSKKTIEDPDLSNEKLLYKYDFDELISIYDDSLKTSKKSNSKAELPKPRKLSSKSRLSFIKSKVGHMFKTESTIKDIVKPRPESNRTSINESYLPNAKSLKEISDDEQRVKFGEHNVHSTFQDDFFEMGNFSGNLNASISSLDIEKVNPADLGKCFLRGFRPDNVALKGDTCLKISQEEKDQRRLKPQLYSSPSIDFSERETPLDFLLALGFSIDEASNAIKDEDVKNRLLAAIIEARIWINKISALQGTLLYLIAYKTKPKIMRYFLQLVEAIINKRVYDAVQLDGFLRILEKVEDGDLAMVAILGSEKFADDDNDETLVKKQLREIFITVYKIAETESQSRNIPLSKNAITLLRTLAAKYRAGLHPHLELIAKYIGQGLLQSEVQLEAAMIYLSRLDTAYVNLEEFETYTAIKCPNKKQ